MQCVSNADAILLDVFLLHKNEKFLDLIYVIEITVYKMVWI